MEEKETLKNEICALAIEAGKFSAEQIGDIKKILDVVFTDYDIGRIQTSLARYEGDVCEQMLKRFVLSKKVEGLSDRSLKYYYKTMKNVCSEVNKPFQDWTADDIRKYLALRQIRDKVSDTTRDNERRNISAFFLWATKEEILPKNIMLKIPKIKCQKKSKKAFSEMEVERIRNYASVDERLTVIIEVLLSTGCRVSELVGMKIDDIEGNTVIVHGKGNKDRTVYLNAKAQLAIEQYMKKRSDNNSYLLPKRINELQKLRSRKDWWTIAENVSEKEHMDLGSVERIIRVIGRKVGVKAHPHKFRRTCATMALKKGMPLTHVSKMLGHEQINTTQIYLDLTDEELESMHKKYVN